MISMNPLMSPGVPLQPAGLNRMTTYHCGPGQVPGSLGAGTPFVLPGLCSPMVDPSVASPSNGVVGIGGVGSGGGGGGGLLMHKGGYTFCHDYLNSVCKRKICKYIHCSKEEEDMYRKTGVLPERLKFLADNGLSVLANMQNSVQEIPVCRDYQRGFCERGDHCKFTHPPNLDKVQTDHPNNSNQLKRTNCEFPTEHEEKEASPASGQSDSLTTTNSPKLAKLDLEERSSVLSETDVTFDSSTIQGTEANLADENRKLKENLQILTKRVEELSNRNRDLQMQNSKMKSAAEEMMRSQRGLNGNMYQPSQLVQPLKPIQQQLLSPQNIAGIPAGNNPAAAAFQSVPSSAQHMITSQHMTSPIAMQQIMQQQFSNKVLCQQMVYNAALLSTALNQSNSSTYSNPTVLFTSQPITAAGSWTSMENNHHHTMIEEITDHKSSNIYPN